MVNINFDETRLYKGFARNVKGQKYPPRNPQPLPLEGVNGYDGFSGIMNPNTVLIDADEEPYNSILQNIVTGEELSVFMTDREGGRGVHVLMVNNDISLKKADKVMLACGIIADFHLGYSLPGECLKYNGAERVPIYNRQPYQEMPKYFTPLPKCNIDFANMGEGDGRNSTLFAYILTLQNAGFDEDDIRDTIRIINKDVLTEPMEEKELDVILRDEALKKQVFFPKSKFSHDKFAEHIKTQYHVKKINGQLHIYENGIYVPGYDAIERAMVREISSLTSNQRNEVLKYLKVVCVEEEQSADLNLIPFKNGVYNLNTDCLEQFSPNHIIMNQIPWNYNPDAKSDLVDSVLDRLSCGNADIRYSLEEVAGACLYRSAAVGGGMAAILIGDKYNGKSTFIGMVKSMLGNKNYSALEIKELGDRFSTETLYGKLANIGDDISGEYIQDASVFKKLVTGEVVKAERKGQDPFNFVSYAMQIYSANDIPRIKDPTGAVFRRLLLIPLNGKFTKDAPDYAPFIKYKLEQAEHMEYFIQLALDGLSDVLRNKCFTVSEKSAQQKSNYEVENNPVLAFVEESGKESIINQTTADVYKRYQVFCAENGFNNTVSKITFSKSVNRILETKTRQTKINGKNRSIVK